MMVIASGVPRGGESSKFLSEVLGLPSWERPALANLAFRGPYMAECQPASTVRQAGMEEAQPGYVKFAEQLQHAVDTNRHVLAAASTAAQGYLRPQLDTPEGTREVYGLLENALSGSSFLAKITTALRSGTAGGAAVAIAQGSEVYQPEFFEAPPGSCAASGQELSLAEEHSFEQVHTEDTHPPEEPLNSYVIVSKEDVLDAIGTFVAAYLAELPQAQNLQPAELQVAIKNAFKELRKSRMQQLWVWGRAIYRCAAFSYGAFSVYENPWLVRAVLAALWTASKIMLGLLV